MTGAAGRDAQGVWALRVLAAGLDILILAVLFVAFSAASGGIDVGDGEFWVRLEGLALLLYVAFVFVYFWAFEWRMAATPGKRIKGVAVFAAGDGETGPGRSAARNLLRFVDWLPLPDEDAGGDTGVIASSAGEGNEELLEAAQRTVALEGARYVELRWYRVDSDGSVGFAAGGSIDPAAASADLRIEGNSTAAVRVLIEGDGLWFGPQPVGAPEPEYWYQADAREIVESGLLPLSSDTNQLLMVSGARVVGPAPDEMPDGETVLSVTQFELDEALLDSGAVPELTSLVTEPLQPPEGSVLTGYAGVDAEGVLRSLRVAAECGPGDTSRLEIQIEPVYPALEVEPPLRDDIRDTVGREEAAKLMREMLSVEPAEISEPPDRGVVDGSCGAGYVNPDPSF